MTKFKIGVYTNKGTPTSVRVYIRHITSYLEQNGVECVFFNEESVIPSNVDLFWDPRAAGGGQPFNHMKLNRYKMMKKINIPVIITQHSAMDFSVPPREYYRSFRAFIGGKRINIIRYWKWFFFRNYEKIITVSEYAKYEITKYLPIDKNRVIAIYHGVDHDTFNVQSTKFKKNNYFLHVSSYQPVKNVNRIIEAYRNLSVNNKPKLKLVVPNFDKDISDKNIEIIRDNLTHEQLAPLYQGAMAFVFPSIIETFGLPILEAMASGCPVITSNASACKEVSGDAALLVDPYSIEEIKIAMQSICCNEDLRHTLKNKGLIRSRQFSWELCADKHLQVFSHTLKIK